MCKMVIMNGNQIVCFNFMLRVEQELWRRIHRSSQSTLMKYVKGGHSLITRKLQSRLAVFFMYLYI